MNETNEQKKTVLTDAELDNVSGGIFRSLKDIERQHFDNVVSKLLTEYPNWHPTKEQLHACFGAYFSIIMTPSPRAIIPYIKNYFNLQ